MGEQEDERSVVRVSDAERRETAERLTIAHDEGRLSLTEYDERLQRAFAATVRADLDAVVADLPAVERSALPSVREETTRVEKAEARHEWLTEWRSWAGAAVVMVGIWLVTGLVSGDGFPSFWPAWPLGIWALVIVAGAFWKD
ncbi:DUF1707 SHOCT-like domain-containing protein [Pseudonocardia spirodelae]|uniref:DUF1707 domain-containing protein n=1 Tax=Pseudonocardia spirodelae TaxID=3133431 RepID=A0ABU8TBV3_9PSEU